MEVIQLLEMCQKRFTTVKQAFSRFGLLELKDGNKSFNKLNEKEVFAYLMNWALNNMQLSEHVNIRYKVEDNTYQFRIGYQERHLRVTKPQVISDKANFISYIWTADDVYNQLNVKKIMESIQRADEQNGNQGKRNTSHETNEDEAEGSQELTNNDHELIESFLENI